MTIFDDIQKVQEALRAMQEQVETNRAAIVRTDEQVNGARGLAAALNGLAEEVKSLRKAAYWVAGLIVMSSIAFAFSVLALIPA